MTDLSPAALNVWNKFCGTVEDHGPPRLALAAALRTAADHLPDPQMSAHFLHAIAAELEQLP